MPAPSSSRTACTIRRSLAQASRATGVSSIARACASRKRRVFSVSTRWPSTRSVPPMIMAFPWPENAERKRPWFGSVNARPSRRVIHSGPSTGRAATSPTVNLPSAHAGTSCTQSTSGLSTVARRSISSRNARRCGGLVLPWKRFQLRTSTRLRYFGARPARRSAGVHPVVRPSARRRARTRRSRRRAC